MISRETIERVKREANLIEIIGESVELKRQGRNYVGLCPFHAERSPSFMVQDSGERYHCFGCGASGNVVSFIMARRGIGFPDAIRDLAERYGIEVKYEGSQRADRPNSDTQALYALHDLAQQYFVDNLKKADKRIKQYVASRNLTSESIEAFGIGFAPDGWNGLTDYLQAKGCSVELILKSGLVARAEQGKLYDRFRARLMFPISIDQKRIVAFGGRIIPSLVEPSKLNTLAKYLNSPETELYRKSRTLFGVPQALDAIRKSGALYLVEGYMDVIGLWQRGIKNVVATCGTAVTEEHVQRIKHLTRRVIVLFDGDSAGKRASAKLFQVFLNSTLDGVAKFLPEGDDPDTFAEKNASKLEDALKELPELALFESHIENLIEESSQNRALGAAFKGKIASEIAALTAKVENVVERRSLLERASARLMVSMEEFEQLAKAAPAKPERVELKQEPSLGTQISSPKKLPRLDQELLRALVTHRELIAPFLAEVNLTSEVSEETVHFLSELKEISESELTQEEKRERTLTLLRTFGDEWISFWKDAHEMLNDQRVDLNKSYLECLSALKRKKLRSQVSMIEQEILLSQDPQYKVRLAQEKIGILRKINEISIA